MRLFPDMGGLDSKLGYVLLCAPFGPGQGDEVATWDLTNETGNGLHHAKPWGIEQGQPPG